MRNIALIGRARSGKDSIAKVLVKSHGYRRVAFADPLKAMALSINPSIVYHVPGFTPPEGSNILLADLVEHVGWERAKDDYPEVRRLLQQMGHAVRQLDPDFWLRQGLRSAHASGAPVVVTDVRYLNEAHALRHAGYYTVRVVRPETEPIPGTEHASETELDGYPTDMTFVNNGTLATLESWANVLPLTR